MSAMYKSARLGSRLLKEFGQTNILKDNTMQFLSDFRILLLLPNSDF